MKMIIGISFSRHDGKGDMKKKEIEKREIVHQQGNRYFRVNTGGEKQLGMPIQTIQGLESDFYT